MLVCQYAVIAVLCLVKLLRHTVLAKQCVSYVNNYSNSDQNSSSYSSSDDNSDSYSNGDSSGNSCSNSDGNTSSRHSNSSSGDGNNNSCTTTYATITTVFYVTVVVYVVVVVYPLAYILIGVEPMIYVMKVIFNGRYGETRVCCLASDTYLLQVETGENSTCELGFRVGGGLSFRGYVSYRVHVGV